MQSDLFTMPPAVELPPPPISLRATDGRGRRDTSRAAYAEVRATGGLSNGQARVLTFLTARPGRAFTRAEIARGTGMPLSGCCGRVNELIHIKRLLVEDPRRACAVSGKAAHPVRLP